MKNVSSEKPVVGASAWSRIWRQMTAGAGGAVLVSSLVGAGAAAANPDSCREWRAEHRRWKTEALVRVLLGAPERDVDDAIFEVLQREAYLTSCETSLEGGRDAFLGWRLVGRPPEEYGSAVAESLLERAGFDLDLKPLFLSEPEMEPARSRPGFPRSRHGRRPR